MQKRLHVMKHTQKKKPAKIYQTDSNRMRWYNRYNKITNS